MSPDLLHIREACQKKCRSLVFNQTGGVVTVGPPQNQTYNLIVYTPYFWTFVGLNN